MSQQKLQLKINGLYTHPNDFSEVPTGALEVADNIVIDRESIAESRRGNKQYSGEKTDPKKLFNYRQDLLLHTEDKIQVDDGSGNFSDIVSGYDGPRVDLKIQSEEMNNNVYMTTDQGVLKIDGTGSGDGQLAGAPRALDLSGVATATVGGFLPDTHNVAYRIVWSYTDQNNNLILGAPSTRIVVNNATGSDASVDLEFTVPPGINTDYFFEIYRTKTIAGFDPGDEGQLVIRQQITAPEITAGLVTINDNIANDDRGAFIYTAPTQEGILQANTLPPFAIDVTEYRDRLWYANTFQVQRATVKFSDFSAGNTVSSGAFTVTAAVSEDVALNEFDGSIDSLVRVWNRSATNPGIVASIVSGNTVLFERTSVTGAAFTITSTNLTSAEDSSNDEFKNRVYFSKAGQPEAVPLLNFVDVGDEDKEIIRILSVRDALFVLKEDGVFRVTGTDETNFFVEQHDTTIRMVGPETAVKFANQVFCMSHKGVVAISVSGVTLVSRPIERTLLRLSLQNAFDQRAFAVAYDSDRKYLLAVQGNDNDTRATQVFVYNTITASWTRWPLELRHGLVKNRDDVLYLVRYLSDTTGDVLQERKARTLDDYADDEFDVTIVSSSGNTVTLSDVSEAAVNQTLRQGSLRSVITGIDEDNNTVTVAEERTWDNDAAQLFNPIDVKIQWVKEDVENPGVIKHFSYTTFFFEDARFSNIDFLCNSNFVNGFTVTNLTVKPIFKWGNFAWGNVPWGGNIGGPRPVPTLIPREQARAHWIRVRLELNQAFTALTLSGASIMYNLMHTRFRG